MTWKIRSPFTFETLSSINTHWWTIKEIQPCCIKIKLFQNPYLSEFISLGDRKAFFTCIIISYEKYFNLKKKRKKNSELLHFLPPFYWLLPDQENEATLIAFIKASLRGCLKLGYEYLSQTLYPQFPSLSLQ